MRFIDACGSLERSDKGNQPQKGRRAEIFVYFVVFKVEIVIFILQGPRAPRGTFSFAHSYFSSAEPLGAQNGPKMVIKNYFFDAFFGGRFWNAFLSVFERPRAAQERPRAGQRAAQEHPRAAKERPRAAQERPRASKERPRAAQERPRAAKERQRAAKSGPRTAQSDPTAAKSSKKRRKKHARSAQHIKQKAFESMQGAHGKANEKR